ncbi:hypothetical protein [Rhodopirellula baltica]
MNHTSPLAHSHEVTVVIQLSCVNQMHLQSKVLPNANLMVKFSVRPA